MTRMPKMCQHGTASNAAVRTKFYYRRRTASYLLLFVLMNILNDQLARKVTITNPEVLLKTNTKEESPSQNYPLITKLGLLAMMSIISHCPIMKWK